MAFAAVIDLTTLNGSNGGLVISGLDNDLFGSAVSSAGDINGDGYTDFIVGARGWNSDPGNGSPEGAAYVVFGGATGFPANFNVTSLNGHNGFALHGDTMLGYFGWDVAGIGDINKDGFADVLVTASIANNFHGAAYVIYGRNAAVSGDFAAVYSAGAIGAGLPGSHLFGTDQITLGESADAIGDINHDGFTDFAVGALGLGGQLGGAFVIYGRAAPLPATITEADLDGTLGFRLLGSAPGDYAGRSISGAGDINGDGIDDLIIGAANADTATGGHWSGAAFVLFGRDAASQGAFAASVSLADLDGSNGFRIDGATPHDFIGKGVQAIGDINGDGFGDLAVGGDDGNDSAFDGQGTGAIYIVYGRDSAVSGNFNAVISTADISGPLGFRIQGVTPGDYIGRSVAGLGDVNGDGVDDFVIGALGASPDGVFYAGGAYVVFGSRTGFAGGVNLATLNGTNGFFLKGGLIASKTGWDVHSAGDLNGDGVGDIVVSAPYGSTPGQLGNGAVYIVYGQGAGPITQTGGSGDDVIDGGPAGDTLSGLGGKDTISGLGGDDTIDGGDGNDRLYGGAGADVVRGGDGGDTIYGGDGVDDVDGGLGADKLYGDGGDDIIVGALGNDYIYGGADNDTLTGNAGNDYLDGGAGIDAMAGGADNDVYIVDNLGDTVTENVGEGSDIVRAFVTFTLGDNLETLQLQGADNIDGTGNALANNLQGNAGNNTLSGGAGVDTINGNDGDDIIVGGLNNDLLRGGMGADSFRILEESINTTVLETDTIYDFSTAEGDRLDLSAIDANTLVGGNQGFVLVSSFTHAGGEMTMTFSGGQTLIRLDVDGDNAADYQLKINGDVRLDSGGWLL